MKITVNRFEFRHYAETEVKALKKVLVDGHYGTVNLNLNKLLAGRDDLEIIALESRNRVSPEQRISLLNTADIVILCQSAQTVVETIPLITERRSRNSNSSKRCQTRAILRRAITPSTRPRTSTFCACPRARPSATP